MAECPQEEGVSKTISYLCKLLALFFIAECPQEEGGK